MLSDFISFPYNILGCLAILSLAGYLAYIVKWKPMIQLTQNIPGLPALPIIGHSLYLTNVPRDAHIKFFLDQIVTYGKTIKVWLAGQLILVFIEPADVECILNDRALLDKPAMYSFLEPWLNDGLLSSKTEKWQKRRKIITPTFHFETLKEFVQIFEKHSRIFLENLQKECNKPKNEGFDLDNLLDKCALDVICESAMGVCMHTQSNRGLDYVEATRTISKALYQRLVDMRYFFDITFRFTRLYGECQKALNILHEFSESVIIKRRQELLKTYNADPKIPKETDDEVKPQRMVFLDILLRAQIDGKPLSNSDIREEVDTFMFGGHGTTSQCLLFLFYNLGLYRDCQQKVWAEIMEVMGEDKTKPITYEDLNKLEYMDMCIKESLRMYSPAAFMGRYAPVQREINGKTIPANTILGFSSFAMGRQSDIFPEPLTFKPERFSRTTDGPQLHRYSCIPFSLGPRSCIGKKFAMLEVKTIVANALRYYEFESMGNKNEEVQLTPGIVLGPKQTLLFKIKPRVAI